MILNISKTKELKLVIMCRPAIIFCMSYLPPEPIGAEIGTHHAGHALQILSSLKPKLLYLVDPYNFSSETPENNITTTNDDLKIAQDNLRFYPQAKFIVKSSIEGAKEIEDESLDFVYIDAEHTYEAVKADILAWTPKVKCDGVIAGHDWTVKGVQEAVKEVTTFPNSPKENIFGNFYHFGDDRWFVKNPQFNYTHIS